MKELHPDAPVARRRISRLRWAISTILLFALLLLWWLFLSGEFKTFEIAGESMVPTLNAGERVLGRKTSVLAMQRGDIVVIASPEGWGSELVKRLVALPGDTIQFRDGLLHVNGQPSPPPEGDPISQPGYDTPPDTLSDGLYYVMGDNRPRSDDSQEFGALGESDFWGKVIYRYSPAEQRGPVK